MLEKFRTKAKKTPFWICRFGKAFDRVLKNLIGM